MIDWLFSILFVIGGKRSSRGQGYNGPFYPESPEEWAFFIGILVFGIMMISWGAYKIFKKEKPNE